MISWRVPFDWFDVFFAWLSYVVKWNSLKAEDQNHPIYNNVYNIDYGESEKQQSASN